MPVLKIKSDEDIIKKVVAMTHGGNREVVETSDFIAGVKSTLKYLKKKKVIQNIKP